ncbi:hypothetical protein DLM75_16510 [Leptospira stimsonii]|uniref:Uncharacterized protein n=1 Tax=Leptospira stimsonii TaxID=2202203 RepID=A0A396Z3T9_9LEPT|nr:hypothetical protein DLM75_16510 [Leptospira stimsonii]
MGRAFHKKAVGTTRRFSLERRVEQKEKVASLGFHSSFYPSLRIAGLERRKEKNSPIISFRVGVPRQTMVKMYFRRIQCHPF